MTDRLVWLASRSQRPDRRRWSPADVERLEAMIGKNSPSEIARELMRSRHSVLSKLQSLGYRISTDVMRPIGINGTGLARRLGMPYEVLWRDIRAGRLPARKEHRKDYLIRWPDVKAYERRVRLLLDRRARVLAAITEPTIGKSTFERLLGLSVTQAQRYLDGKIVRGWKIPAKWTSVGRQHWEWRVSLGDTRRIKALREAGQLSLRTPEYRRIQLAANADIVRLRSAKRLGVRDDLRHARSSVVPGCYAVAQVASRVGLSYERVRQHIHSGRLPAQSVRVGRRTFYAIEKASLPAYIAWTHRTHIATGPIRPWNTAVQQVHAEGHMTLTEAAQRYGIGRAELARLVHLNAIRALKIAGLWSVRTCDVRYWVKNNKRGKA